MPPMISVMQKAIFIELLRAMAEATELEYDLPPRAIHDDYQLSAEDIQRHRYVMYRRHNSTEYTPEHYVQIPNYKAE
jgi:hypothetical protein